jgi:hypothetical protein
VACKAEQSKVLIHSSERESKPCSAFMALCERYPGCTACLGLGGERTSALASAPLALQSNANPHALSFVWFAEFSNNLSFASAVSRMLYGGEGGWRCLCLFRFWTNMPTMRWSGCPATLLSCSSAEHWPVHRLTC